MLLKLLNQGLLAELLLLWLLLCLLLTLRTDAGHRLTGGIQRVIEFTLRSASSSVSVAARPTPPDASLSTPTLDTLSAVVRVGATGRSSLEMSLFVGVLIFRALTSRTLTILKISASYPMRLDCWLLLLLKLLVVGHNILLLLLSRWIVVNLLRLLLLLLKTLIKLLKRLVIGSRSSKTMMARDRQKLIVIFVCEVECEHRGAIA